MYVLQGLVRHALLAIEAQMPREARVGHHWPNPCFFKILINRQFLQEVTLN